jgi:ABC-2 type transport system permease protein
MTNPFPIAAAFVRRDFRIATSYKFNFTFQLTSGFLFVATFYFIAKLVGTGAASEALRQYNTDYFSFVLIGVATQGFLDAGLAGFTSRLRTAMTEGTLEIMFACPIRPAWVLVMPCLWSFVYESLGATLIILFGVVVFGADLTRANLPAALLVALLTITSYSVFGLLSASIIMLVKRGDPINWAVAHLTALVAGAYFPIELLPNWLEWLAQLLPMTHSYRALRLTLLTGGSLPDVARELAILAGISAVGLPLAFAACNAAITRAKRAGSLGTF